MSDVTLTSTTDSAETIQAILHPPEPAAEPAKAEPDATPAAPEAKPDEPAPAADAEAQKVSEAAKTLAERANQSRLEKRQGQIQAEIDAATRRKYDLLREVEDLERRRQASAAQSVSPQPTPTTTQAEDPEPKLDDPAIADYEDWRAKHELWTARRVAREELKAFRDQQAKETAEREAAAKARTEAEQRQQAMTAHQARIKTFAADHADYAEVLQQVTDPMSDDVRDGIVESPLGPALAYHLAQHPDEYHAIRSLTGREAFRALGKLEARLEPSPSPSATPVKPTSSAPEPITPVRGAAVPKPDAEPSDFQAYKRQREAEEARARGRK